MRNARRERRSVSFTSSETSSSSESSSSDSDSISGAESISDGSLPSSPRPNRKDLEDLDDLELEQVGPLICEGLAPLFQSQVHTRSFKYGSQMHSNLIHRNSIQSLH